MEYKSSFYDCIITNLSFSVKKNLQKNTPFFFWPDKRQTPADRDAEKDEKARTGFLPVRALFRSDDQIY